MTSIAQHAKDFFRHIACGAACLSLLSSAPAGDVFPSRSLPAHGVSSAAAYTTQVAIALSTPAPSACILEEVLPAGWTIVQATWNATPFMPTTTGTTSKWLFGISPVVETGTLRYVTLPTNVFERTYSIAGAARYLQGTTNVVQPVTGIALVNASDADSDGIPDDWESLYFGGPTNALAAKDYDGDTMTALQEYLADTDPTNNESRLAIRGICTTGDQVWIAWQGGAAATQHLERGDALSTGAAWKVVHTVHPRTALSNAFTESVGTNTTAFYRIRATR